MLVDVAAALQELVAGIEAVDQRERQDAHRTRHTAGVERERGGLGWGDEFMLGLKQG